MSKGKDALYMCAGENWLRSPYIKMGYCGDTHTLTDWLKILFFEYDEEQLATYFIGMKSRELIAYIYEVKGKRLVKA